MKVYAIDDEDYIRDILELNLKKYPDIFLKTFSKPEALFRAISEEKPDIIVSDVIMQDMNGLEICKKIKSSSNTSDIYFILLTAKISIDDKIAGFESGADDYIAKPFKIKELAARIRVGGRLIETQKNNLLLIENLKTKNIELIETQRKLIASEKLMAIGKILSIISHEIKNPLFSVQNLIYKLAGQNTERNEITEQIIERINFCVEIIENINAFSKSNEPVLEEADIFDVINQSLIMLTVPNNVNIQFEQKDTFSFKCDIFQIRIVIMNIIKNAVEKFGIDKGEIKISFFLNNGVRIIEICDNGKPIDNSIDIFEPFITTKHGGTGLGLAFSKMIIEKHNGKITAENTDEGVCFRISL